MKELTKEYLEVLYIDKNFSLNELVELLGIPKTTLARKIKAFGIKKEKSSQYIRSGSPVKGKIAYNNGVTVIYLSDMDIPPEGFTKGGLSTRSHSDYVASGISLQRVV